MSESISNTRVNILKTNSIASQMARKAVFNILNNITNSLLVIEEGEEQTIFGEQVSQGCLQAHIKIEDPSVYIMILKDGDLGAGEAYMLGLWSSP